MPPSEQVVMLVFWMCQGETQSASSKGKGASAQVSKGRSCSTPGLLRSVIEHGSSPHEVAKAGKEMHGSFAVALPMMGVTDTELV